MICDLRDFTGSPTTGRATTSSIFLNGYLTRCRSDRQTWRRDSEIIGDGLLAIFPLSQPSACANLLHA